MQASIPERSDAIIRRHVLLAAGAGLIPLPLADLAAVTGIQMSMLTELAENQGIPFSRHRAQSIVSSLLAGLASREIASMGLATALKLIPGVGTALGVASLPLAAAAFTYAIGTVFRDLFAAGRNLESFNPEHIIPAFRQQFSQSRKIAAEIIGIGHETSASPKELKIYCVVKPNIGKYGKVYLKTYIDGRRPEKYLGTIDEFKVRYAVDNLETVKSRIIDDYRAMFLQYVASRAKDVEVSEFEPIDL